MNILITRIVKNDELFFKCTLLEFDVETFDKSMIQSIIKLGEFIKDNDISKMSRNKKEMKVLEKKFNKAPFRFLEKFKDVKDSVFHFAVETKMEEYHEEV